MKLGGAWGGFLNLEEVMLEVVTGLNWLVDDAVGFTGRIWFKVEPSREIARKGARLMKVTRVKRARETMKKKRPLKRASLVNGEI